MSVQKRLRAFTLIELLIVITIIGILAVALVPKIIGAPEKARDAQRKADLQQIATALELYQDDNSGNYPTAVSACIGDGDSDGTEDLSGYLTALPDDPKTGDCYSYYNLSGGGYILTATLENENATGDRIYETDTVVTAKSATENFTAWSLCADDETADGNCLANGAMYATGR